MGELSLSGATRSSPVVLCRRAANPSTPARSARLRLSAAGVVRMTPGSPCWTPIEHVRERTHAEAGAIELICSERALQHLRRLGSELDPAQLAADFAHRPSIGPHDADNVSGRTARSNCCTVVITIGRRLQFCFDREKGTRPALYRPTCVSETVKLGHTARPCHDCILSLAVGALSNRRSCTSSFSPAGTSSYRSTLRWKPILAVVTWRFHRIGLPDDHVRQGVTPFSPATFV